MKTISFSGRYFAPGGESLTRHDYWREIVIQFTSRSLTYQTDTLPALSGLARVFEAASGDTYLAGIWRRGT